ncbi:hypothetical protein DASC09_062010 [Saccharomycopsis crataegensis]|uniref:STAS domain-containing protein n=1 Tax=Saccharomycopsis crataegensis TaxID=43959 RepID=A0AAV5QVD1_9ASCO|nr:hypothetical protein DASC09_062010 [Saccharomycopsis crataegensis]
MIDENTPLIKPKTSKANSSHRLRLPASNVSAGSPKRKSSSGLLDPASASAIGRPKLFHSSSSTSIASANSYVYDSFKITKNKYNKSSEGNERWTYLCYYFPILSWLPNYDASENILGDIVAGFSLAAFQIPLVVSFACLIGIDVRCGLFAIIISPVAYSVFGSCLYLMTGPGAAMSMIVGSLIESITHNNQTFSAYDVLACTTFIIGAILFIAGLFRLGFLGNVVSQGLLSGFISAFGILMIVAELLTELRLGSAFAELHEVDPSTIDKLTFIFDNLDLVHPLTAKISAVAVLVLSITRYSKKWLINRDAKRFGWLNFFPEILVVVIVSIILSNHYKWDKEGVVIIGKYFGNSQRDVDASPLQKFKLPVSFSNFKLVKKCLSTAFICSILCFIETSTATKSLENQRNTDFSMNRDMVGIGIGNIIGSFFTILPTFGSYGRSKINALTAKSQLSGVVLSLISLIFYVYFLEVFYYLPECVLAAIITSVSLSLVEECPENLRFYLKIKGYDEIIMFSIIVLSTLFWSPDVGLSLGIGLSIIKVIKFSTRTRIEILGRVPNTNIFRNADELIEESFDHLQKNQDHNQMVNQDDIENNSQELVSQLEEIENCLIIKITEPLIFANSSELKLRLKRIEKYGSLNVHPSQKPLINKRRKIKYIIIDCKSMTGLDSSATLTLYEIVGNYTKNNYIVLFTRVPFVLQLRKKLTESGISKLVKQALDKHFGNNFVIFDNSADGDNIENNSGILEIDSSDCGANNFPSTLGRRDSSLSITSTSLGLGEGFYASIDDALKVVSDCEIRRSRRASKRS